MNRLQELKIELENERISWGELFEIDSLARDAGLVVTDEMLASDIINELEQME